MIHSMFRLRGVFFVKWFLDGCWELWEFENSVGEKPDNEFQQIAWRGSRVSCYTHWLQPSSATHFLYLRINIWTNKRQKEVILRSLRTASQLAGTARNILPPSIAMSAVCCMEWIRPWPYGCEDSVVRDRAHVSSCVSQPEEGDRYLSYTLVELVLNLI